MQTVIEQEHPVPQQISSYQFRLVGDMTLKQFSQLAGGILIALVLYAIPIPSFVKWPLIAFFVIMGIALAFVPLKERSLSTWIVIFFRSVYSPTRYWWKRTDKPHNYFQPEPTEAILPPTFNQGVLDSSTPLEEKEVRFLSKITKMATGAATVSSLEVNPDSPTIVVPQITPIQSQQPQKGYQIPVLPPLPPKMKPIVEETTTISPLYRQSTPASAGKVQFSSESAPPNPPTIPNVIAGQVTDNQGKIIEGAILEIKDGQNRPVRALKTNKAGHFLIVTPLVNGKYQLLIEKEGFIFNPVEFEAQGKIIQSILIKANEHKTN
ncbi:hypothetical protein A3D00_04385 [Candidatus Woesebacteria bacterium RIFCSPHIGHO2_02_FULL_38_9]|uniref:Uncharacterized protein n=1 Tax=Candidatus Woesebacteria bacterium RIFCSPHIGHO2_01_FULL_39_28 TaxID=1802496 RepID=A0A1F7YL85_9BACT|nr:MAG: hypothetical protein A2627_00600 [Candidatus Woesebacteria bacterium RIFCSPHIGHO2_01_FULL_39_28]OGM31354.1 MAG: hypothetical protein A3D00_04385 [Candidatus Woesebacteria bacterium RIFCSPHIGHO2_02_FULL_38_9]OGM56689.1 MAG: hypothetical protein A3A50_05020 [Candidatus Woesebacteria bacterium RIFCSPLOWO2_01_FULL_38_20]